MNERRKVTRCKTFYTIVIVLAKFQTLFLICMCIRVRRIKNVTSIYTSSFQIFLIKYLEKPIYLVQNDVKVLTKKCVFFLLQKNSMPREIHNEELKRECSRSEGLHTYYYPDHFREPMLKFWVWICHERACT